MTVTVQEEKEGREGERGVWSGASEIIYTTAKWLIIKNKSYTDRPHRNTACRAIQHFCGIASNVNV